jgi:hypothetical protein
MIEEWTTKKVLVAFVGIIILGLGLAYIIYVITKVIQYKAEAVKLPESSRTRPVLNY